MKRFVRVTETLIVDVKNGNSWHYHSPESIYGLSLKGPGDEWYGEAAERLWQSLCYRAGVMNAVSVVSDDPSWVGQKPKWEDVPEEFNWIAQDSDCWIYAYEYRPVASEVVGDWDWVLSRDECLLRLIRHGKAGEKNPEWRETLACRPGYQGE